MSVPIVKSEIIAGADAYIRMVTLEHSSSLPDDLNDLYKKLASDLFYKQSDDDADDSQEVMEMCEGSQKYLRLLFCNISIEEKEDKPRFGVLVAQESTVNYFCGELYELTLINSTLLASDIKPMYIEDFGTSECRASIVGDTKLGYHALNNTTIVYIDGSFPLLSLALQGNINILGSSPHEIPEMIEDYQSPEYAKPIVEMSIFRAKHSLVTSGYKKQATFL